MVLVAALGSNGYSRYNILNADSNYVTILFEHFWFYGMFANSCDSVSWQVIAKDLNITTEVDFFAYSTILNCDNNPNYCFESDTTFFSIPIIIDIVNYDDDNINPTKYTLSQNYPNPFNPSTIINYELPKVSYVNLSIYDLNGTLINTLINQSQTPGKKSVKWNGVNNNKSPVSTGVYIYQIKTENFSSAKKMIFLK